MGERLCEHLVVAVPWITGMKVPFDPKLGPVLQLDLDVVRNRLGLQAQRIPTQIDERCPILLKRKVELLPKTTQWVCFV